ncbi:MAG: substrate-binding domain-containing protein [Bacteroidetes bacterium]|nr:substrate-binding domain-containing protein [Bacteroidota bacterium]
MKSIFCILASLLIFFTACNNKVIDEPTDTLTSGKTTIAIDESYTFLFETFTRVFEDTNPEAKINTLVQNEKEAIKSLLDDSCKVIVSNRELSKNEIELFNSKNIYPKTTLFAYDAVAIISNTENKDSTLDVEDFKKILIGKITKWNELGKSSDKDILVIFDNPNSANFHYIKDSLLNGADLQKNCFGVNSNKEVIEYVSKNKNAIGVVSAGWITDDYSNISKAFLKKINVMGIGHKSSGLYYKPYQYYIADNSYPFIRRVFLINRQTRMGLGTGFVNFICNIDKGQLILTKAGLVPVYLKVRDIKANVE